MEGGGRDGGKWVRREQGGTQTGPNTGRTCHFHRLHSLFCTPGRTLPCFIFNRSPGVMAGLPTSASISSFITWSTCSGHRSLHGLRSFATFAAARRSNLPNRGVLDRTSITTGPSQNFRVRSLISRVSPSGPADAALRLLETSGTSVLQHLCQHPGTRIKCSGSRRTQLQPK